MCALASSPGLAGFAEWASIVALLLVLLGVAWRAGSRVQSLTDRVHTLEKAVDKLENVAIPPRRRRGDRIGDTPDER